MAMDPVNKKAVKKDFEDRKDQDIDNDGDVDSSDEYLHKRRKAVSKAVKNVKESIELNEKKMFKTQKVFNSENEEIDQLDEISPETLGSYTDKAKKDLDWKKNLWDRTSKQAKKRNRDMKNREKGMKTAVDKLTREDDSDNKEKNDDYGVTHEKGGKVYVAKKTDMGESVELDEGAKEKALKKLMTRALDGKKAKPGYTSAVATNGDFVVHDGGGRIVGRLKKGEYDDPLKESVELDEAAGSKDFFKVAKNLKSLSDNLKNISGAARFQKNITGDTVNELRDDIQVAYNELGSMIQTLKKIRIDESANLEERKKFKTEKVFNSEKEANDFLEKNDDYGVTHEKGGKVYVAKKTDMGESVELDEAPGAKDVADDHGLDRGTRVSKKAWDRLKRSKKNND